MSTVVAFLRTLISTIYSPAFYTAARTERLDKPLRVNAVLAVAGASVLMFLLYVTAVSFAFSNILDRINDVYPSDLVITMGHGTMSINEPQPYHIKNTLMPSGLTDLVIFDGGDTLKGDATQNSTYVLIKSTYAISGGGTSERVTAFDTNQATTTITKADLARFVERVRPYFKPVILVGGLFASVLGALIVAALWLGFHLLYLLVPAGLVYLYGRFRIPQMQWRESYIVALYASIPIAILTFALHVLSFAWPVFFYTLLVMLVALVNLTQVPSEVPTEFREAKD